MIERHIIGKRYDHVPDPVQQPNGLFYCGECKRGLTEVIGRDGIGNARRVPHHFRHQQLRRANKWTHRRSLGARR